MTKGLTTALVRAVLLIAVAAFPLQSQTPEPSYPLEADGLSAGIKPLASSPRSMVTSAHPFATSAGLRTLERGGNAMDACIAATLVVAVADYGLTSVAGGGQLTYYDAESNETIALNMEPNAVLEDVGTYSRDEHGKTGRGVRVPGSIAGFHYAVTEHGRLSWEEVLEPGIFYAEEGIPVNGPAYSNLEDHYATLTLHEPARRIFAPEGFLPPVNSRLKQPELAESLRLIAVDGPEVFYRGAIAEEIVQSVREAGGRMTLNDLERYRVQELDPVRGTYKDYSVVGPPPPATGIVAIIQGLNILEHVDLEGMGHYSRSAMALQWVAETLRVMFEDADRYTGVPEFDQQLGEMLMSKDYARDRYEVIRHRIEQMRRSPSPTDEQPPGDGDFDSKPQLGTNHVSAIDSDGNVCSFTHTIYGSVFSRHGIYVGGMVLNSSGGFRAHPGRRIVTPMAPLIVFKGNEPYFATGSSGGTLNTFLTTLNVLVWEADLQEAQEAPRLRGPGADDNQLTIENRIDPAVADELRRLGYQIEWRGPYSMRNAQMAGIDPATGERYGAADPRGHGSAAGH